MSSLYQVILTLKFWVQVINILIMLYVSRDYLVKFHMVESTLAYVSPILQPLIHVETFVNDTIQNSPSQEPSLSTAVAICHPRPPLAIASFSQKPTAEMCSPKSSVLALPSLTPYVQVATETSSQIPSVSSVSPVYPYPQKMVKSTSDWGVFQNGFALLAITNLVVYTYFIYCYFYRRRGAIAPSDNKSGVSGKSLTGLRRRLRRSTFWSPNRSDRLSHFHRRTHWRREGKQIKTIKN